MQKNHGINSKIINKNSVYNLFLSQPFADIYYCNSVQLTQFFCEQSYFIQENDLL